MLPLELIFLWERVSMGAQGAAAGMCASICGTLTALLLAALLLTALLLTALLLTALLLTL